LRITRPFLLRSDNARREVFEAQGTRPAVAQCTLEQIGLLYDIERRIKGLTVAERYTERQAHALPILEGLHRWTQEMLPKELPSSPMGKALQYMMYSFLGSCTKNGVKPEAWLTQTLQKIPSWHGRRLHELLPNFKG